MFEEHPRAIVIIDETCLLDDDLAAAVEERVLPMAPWQTATAPKHSSPSPPPPKTPALPAQAPAGPEPAQPAQAQAQRALARRARGQVVLAGRPGWEGRST